MKFLIPEKPQLLSLMKEKLIYQLKQLKPPGDPKPPKSSRPPKILQNSD
jgi:hypothetical protein